MFVAWRDLRFARGRFVLIAAVVALITILVGFLSGLTAGLASQNISGILALPADRIVLASPGGTGVTGSDPSNSSAPTFADSAVTADQLDTWRDAAGVESASPVGISQTRAESTDARVAVSIFGVEPGFDPGAPATNGQISLSQAAADDLRVSAGGSVTIAGTAYHVEAVTGDLWYSHTPVVQMTINDWRAYAAATGSPDAFATMLAVTGHADWGAVDDTAATTSNTPLGSLTSIGSFRSEIGSLLMMVAMLFGISALVIGAFFTVWTMQRRGDVAVLQALGASTPSLVRDALGQALVVLIVGVGIGIAVVAGLGAFAGTALPFVLSPLTTALPAAIMVALGLAGAAFALRSVTSADPLTALGGNR